MILFLFKSSNAVVATHDEENALPFAYCQQTLSMPVSSEVKLVQIM